MNPIPDRPPLPAPAHNFSTDVAPSAAPAPDDAPTPDAKLWLVPLAVLAVVQLGAPLLPVPNVVVALVGVTLLTLVYVGGVVAFSLGIARQKWPLSVILAGSVGSALFYKVAQVALQNSPFGGQAQSFALLFVGTFFGLLVARIIRHANMIGPIGVMVALIDIWGVLFGGIVSQLLSNKSTQHVAQHAMASGPRLGAAATKIAGLPNLSLPAIGIGDFLFLALFLGVLVRFGMNWRASATWMWAGVSLALLAIVLLPFVPALPGLLFLGAGAVVPNLRYFQFTREERFALLYAGVFVFLLTVGLYFGLTSMLPKHP